MASLNTLRTKFGVVLSVIIGLALLAFVLSLKTEMGFSGNDPKVGEIAGKKIKYSEYLEAYDKAKMLQPQASEGDPQQADMLSNGAWQELTSKYALMPGFEKMGLKLSETERLQLIRGERVTRTIFNAFADPNTGAYQREVVNNFLAQAETNPEVSRMWARINEELQLERGVDKFLALLKAGTYVNKLEVAQGVAAANNTYSGVWAGKRYNQVPDSLFNVSSSEIRSYYDRHKNMFRQIPFRTISYVVFDVQASSDDMLALTQKVNEVAEEFSAVEDLKAFMRANRNGRIEDRYVTAAQLPADEAEALMAGKMYGPQLKSDNWVMSRVADSKVVPDTLWIRHVVLPASYETLADSLLLTLRNGADFAQTAEQYSAYGATASKGGEVGPVPFAAFQNEFVDALTNAKSGDIVKVASGDAIQLMQVYRVGKPTKHIRVASVNYPVEASADTRRTLHNAAATFAANAAGSVEKFNEAVSIAAVMPRVASIPETERQVRGLEDSREIVRWAYGAKIGDVSEIFTVEGDYVVAVVTGIDEDRFASMKTAEPQIRERILNDKKYDYIVKDAAGSTYEALTQSLGATENGEFAQVAYPMFYIQSLGVEPRVVGAVTSVGQGAFTAPVKGKTGVYVLRVDEVATTAEQTPEAEKARAQAAAESTMEQRSLQAVQQMAKIKDLRNRYF